jgi:hypothetical protein
MRTNRRTIDLYTQKITMNKHIQTVQLSIAVKKAM